MLFVSLFIQFDPNTGDMMKNYYYSFLLLISFIFILIELLPRLKDPLNLLFSFLFVFSSLFLIGFPKNKLKTLKLNTLKTYQQHIIVNFTVTFQVRKVTVTNLN